MRAKLVERGIDEGVKEGPRGRFSVSLNAQGGSVGGGAGMIGGNG